MAAQPLKDPFGDPDLSRPLPALPASRTGTSQLHGPTPVTKKRVQQGCQEWMSDRSTGISAVNRSNKPYQFSTGGENQETAYSLLNPSSPRLDSPYLPVLNPTNGKSRGLSIPSNSSAPRSRSSSADQRSFSGSKRLGGSYTPTQDPRNPFRDPSTSLASVSNFKPSLRNSSRLHIVTSSDSVRDSSPPFINIDLNTPSHDGANSTSNTNASRSSVTKEKRLRETAMTQELKLEAERQKARDGLHPHIPRLLPSPRQALIAQEIGPRFSLTQVTEGGYREKRSALKNPCFWIAFGSIQVGLLSTGAAFAVLLRNKELGESAAIGAGMIFWLVISVVVVVIGFVASLCIWAFNGGHCTGTLRKAGLDEIGLLGRSFKKPRFVGRGIRELDAREEFEMERVDRMTKRQIERDRAGLGESQDSVASIRTQNPVWQALYSTPDELRVSMTDMRSSRGRPLTKQQSTGMESMMSGASESTRSNKLGIEAQNLLPEISAESSAKSEVSARQKTFEVAISSEIATRGRSQLIYAPDDRQSINHSKSSGYRILGGPESHSSSFCDYVSAGPSPSSINNSTSDVISSAPPTEIHDVSPLETLARELNTPELRRLPEEERQIYIENRRSQNLEKSYRVRQSLSRQATVERKPTISRRTLKPIVHERIKSIERRSQSRESGTGLRALSWDKNDEGTATRGVEGVEKNHVVQKMEGTLNDANEQRVNDTERVRNLGSVVMGAMRKDTSMPYLSKYQSDTS